MDNKNVTFSCYPSYYYVFKTVNTTVNVSNTVSVTLSCLKTDDKLSILVTD